MLTLHRRAAALVALLPLAARAPVPPTPAAGVPGPRAARHGAAA